MNLRRGAQAQLDFGQLAENAPPPRTQNDQQQSASNENQNTNANQDDNAKREVQEVLSCEYEAGVG